MGRFGYTYDDSKKLITIMSKNPAAIVTLADSKPLATIDATGKFTNLAYAEQPKSTFDKPKEIPWLDTLQTVLDFAGLIPVIGDALDLINAVIYFWRDKYFEGFLSLIAIIPVVGSIISLGVKGAIKGAKATLFSSKLISRWWLKGETKAVKEFCEYLMKNGVSAKDIRTMAKQFGSFGSMMKNAGKAIPDIAGGKSVAEAMDAAGGSFSVFMKGADKAVDAATTAKQIEKAAEESRKIWKTPKAVANFLSFGLLPKIKKMPFFPTKQLAAMGAKTQDRFIKKSAQSPERLGYLAKFGGTEQRKVVAEEFADLYKKFGEPGNSFNPGNIEKIDAIFKGDDKLVKIWKQRRRSKTIDWDNMLQSATKTENFMKGLSEVDPKLAAEFGETLTNQAVANNNILWNTYKESIANKIISSQTANVLKTSFAKNVDWIWNEMQMAGETLGIESSEHLGKVGIVPLAKWAVASSMPGTYASMQATRDAIVGLSKAAKDTLNVAANAYGFQLSTLEEYPPLGAEQYTYKQGEE
jgi:3-methyladenine DNA glycosylase Tag